MTSSKMNRPTRDLASPIAVEGPFVCSLRSAASAALMGLALLSASTSALAGVPGLNVAVTSLAPLDPVTNTRPIAYSADGVTYQTAYTVTMTATSPVNAAYFYFYTAATNGLVPKFITPVAADLRPTDSCKAFADSTELDCTIGSIATGSTVSFTLLIPSPAKPESGADSVLSLTWAVQAGQGQPNSSNLVHQGSQDVTLHVGSAKDGVQSFVLANETLSVEEAGAETKVKTPKPVTVGVKQVVPGSSCSPQNKKCFESTVTIVDSSSGVPVEIPFTQADPLQVDLFRPVSSLKKGAKFANATLLYKSGGGAWVPIPTCELAGVPASPTQPYAIPTAYPFRCITPQKLPYAATGETGVDSLGNWYFHILGLYNGTTDW